MSIATHTDWATGHLKFVRNRNKNLSEKTGERHIQAVPQPPAIKGNGIETPPFLLRRFSAAEAHTQPRSVQQLLPGPQIPQRQAPDASPDKPRVRSLTGLLSSQISFQFLKIRLLKMVMNAA